MERPEYLKATTIKETRERYRKNQKIFNRAVLLITTGIFAEICTPQKESIVNQVYTEIIQQQEYIRERENDNWGWKKNQHDFSKDADCILQGRENTWNPR